MEECVSSSRTAIIAAFARFVTFDFASFGAVRDIVRLLISDALPTSPYLSRELLGAAA